MVSVNFNTAAMINVNRMNKLEKGLSRSMERVSSGERITRAADDVAAHGVSEKLRGQIRSMSVASRNVQDGIALTNVAEAALNEVESILHRMRELSVQSANGTYTDDDRFNITAEVKKLKEEINYISENTMYNGHKLLNGGGDWGKRDDNIKGGHFQIGANNMYQVDGADHAISAVNTNTLGLDDMFVDTAENAQIAIDKVINAVDYVNDVRVGLGAMANRLEFAWKNTEKMIEDSIGYDSVLRDTDIAEEMIYITRDQIIYQYSTAMLAQANQTPQSIMQLLK